VPVLDDEGWLLLHEIRLRGVATVDEDRVRPLVEHGLVATAARGVRCTTEGRTAHASWARLPPGSNEEAALRRVFERFNTLNRELIAICHDWQEHPGDWKVVDRLTALHDRATPVLTRVAIAHVRFTSYHPRLGAALVRVDAGEREWVTSPRCDSYHTVWMQFHEDVLLALGLEREE
jgi:hypothetical protein